MVKFGQLVVTQIFVHGTFFQHPFSCFDIFALLYNGVACFSDNRGAAASCRENPQLGCLCGMVQPIVLPSSLEHSLLDENTSQPSSGWWCIKRPQNKVIRGQQDQEAGQNHRVLDRSGARLHQFCQLQFLDGHYYWPQHDPRPKAQENMD